MPGKTQRKPLAGKSYGQRCLAGYSPWGHKELDMTEWWSTAQHKSLILLGRCSCLSWRVTLLSFSCQVMSDSSQPHGLQCTSGTPPPPTTAKSLQSCLTLCDPIDGLPPGSAVPGILQARTLEWVAISFSNTRKWKWSRSVVSDTSQPHGLRPTRLLWPWDFPGKSTGVGCRCLCLLLTTYK